MHYQSLTGSDREIENNMWFVTSFENHAESKGEMKIGCGLQQGLKITLNDHLQPKIDNENNYNNIFSIQTIGKSFYKFLFLLIIKVQSSESSLTAACCCCFPYGFCML